MPLSDDLHVCRVKGVESTRLGAELVLLDASGRMLRGLNDTGAAIWRLLDGTHSVARVVEEIAHQYGVSQEKVRPDVEAFLASLLSKGLAVTV